MKEIRIALIGYGSVGKAFAAMLETSDSVLFALLATPLILRSMLFMDESRSSSAAAPSGV